MSLPIMSLDTYLEILSQATPEDGPYNHDENVSNEDRLALNAAFAELTKGVVAYVKVARHIVGYEEARQMLEELVHGFPAQENPTTIDAIKAALLAAMRDPNAPLSTEADGGQGAPAGAGE